MNIEQMTPRDEAIERVLIAMAELPPRRTPWWRSLLAIAGAFAIGGAVTGFLTAGAFAGWTPTPDPDDQRASTMRTFALYAAEASTPLGTPHYYSGTGHMTIGLGEKPAGAVRIVYSFWCLGAGQLSLSVDTGPTNSTKCTPEPAQPVSEVANVQGGGTHTLSVTGTGKYAVWVSWIHQPATAKSSDAQQAAVADGVITRIEYVQAYARLQGCMAQAGFPLSNAPADEVVFGYTLRSEALAAFDVDCYPREFQDVDTMWQGQVDQRLTACLQAAGVTPDRDPTVKLEQLAPAGLTPQGCGLLN